MTTIFYPTEKRFYVKENFTNNITLRPVYPDLYGITNQTVSLNTTDDPEYLLASVNLPPSPYYGGGNLVGGSLKYYVNYVSGAYAAVVPRLKIYKALDSVSFTSGSFSPLYTGNIAAFSSYLDYSVPWMSEGFAGTNKGMGDRESYTKSTVSILPATVYEISGEDLLAHLDNMGYFSLTNRAKKVFARSRNAWKMVLERDGPWSLMLNPTYGEDMYAISALAQEGSKSEFGAFELKGKYGVQTLSNWKAAGAYPNNNSTQMTPPKTYTSYDTDFVGKITQFNSIFNYVSEAMDIEDIKVQTVGDTGDGSKMYTESAFNITTADKLNGSSAGEMRNLYENLSGTALDGAEPSYAKVFGSTPGAASSGSSPYPQTVMASMDYLPRPAALEIGASGTTAGTGPSTCQEIEVITKIKKMPPILTTSGNSNYHFHRGFYIILCQSAPRTEETFHQYIRRIDTHKLTATGLMMYSTVGSQDETPSLYCVPFLDKNDSTSVVPIGYSGFDENMPYSSFNDYSEFNDYIQISNDAWVTMRFKMDSRLSEILMYLPDSFDSKGAMHNMILSATNTAETSGGVTDLNSMSLWLNNMRAINATEKGNTGESGYNPNMNIEIEGFNDEDMENSVLIDSINFKQYNNHYDNASVNNNNPLPSNLIIPPAPVCIPTVSGASSTLSISGNASSADNYYGSESTLTHSTLAFGFDEIPITFGLENQLGLFLNGYGTPNDQLVEAISGSTVSGSFKSLKTSYSYSSSALPLAFNPQYGNIGESTAGASNKLVLTTSPLGGSVEGFTQKGFVWISGTNYNTGWAKANNPFVFARVLAATGDGTDIMVDKPEIFDLPLGAESEGGTDYIMWRPDIQHSDAAAGDQWWAGSGNVGASNVFTSLNQRTVREGNLIHLNRPTNVDDQTGQATTRGSEIPITMASYFPLGYNVDSDGANEWYDMAKLGSIYISPKKYWLNIHIVNATSEDWGDWYRPRENDDENKGFFNYKNVRHNQRYYGTVIASTGAASSSAGTFGSTNNESLFSDGVSVNKWITSATPEGIFEVATNYGFGVFNEGEDGTTDNYGGYINQSAPKGSSYNYISLDKYVEIDAPPFKSKFNFAMVPFFEDSDSFRTYDINIDSTRGSKPPSVYWAFESPLPEISEFRVNPKTKELKRDNIDELTQPEKTNIEFTWNEKSDNIWYRLLWIDTELIQSKYHKANFIAPLNENPGIDSRYYLYSSSAEYISQTNAVAIGSSTPSTYSNIEGVQGYGFSGSVSLNTHAALTLGSASEYTMLCHLKPSTTGTLMNAITTDVSDVSQFTLRLNSDKKLVSTMNASGATLTSTTTYDVDSVQPLAVVITYNKNLDNNNFKMYVNGALEDTKDYTVNFNNTALTLKLADAAYTGFLEEVSWHTKAVHLAQNAGSFSLATKNLPDLTGSTSTSNKYQSRLFLMDYHNVRGASPHDVARSNIAAWKITGV